jgi:hypothetical protein
MFVFEFMYGEKVGVCDGFREEKENGRFELLLTDSNMKTLFVLGRILEV